MPTSLKCKKNLLVVLDVVIYYLLQDSEVLKCSSLNGPHSYQVQHMAGSINSLLIDLKGYFGLEV